MTLPPAYVTPLLPSFLSPFLSPSRPSLSQLSPPFFSLPYSFSLFASCRLYRSLASPNIPPSPLSFSLPSFLPSFLPPFLPSSLPSFLPSFLPPSLPSFLSSFTTSLLPSVPPSCLPHSYTPLLFFFHSVTLPYFL